MSNVTDRFHEIRASLFSKANDAKPPTPEQLTRSMFKPSNDAFAIVVALLVVAEALKPDE